MIKRIYIILLISIISHFCYSNNEISLEFVSSYIDTEAVIGTFFFDHQKFIIGDNKLFYSRNGLVSGDFVVLDLNKGEVISEIEEEVLLFRTVGIIDDYLILFINKEYYFYSPLLNETTNILPEDVESSAFVFNDGWNPPDTIDRISSMSSEIEIVDWSSIQEGFISRKNRLSFYNPDRFIAKTMADKLIMRSAGYKLSDFLVFDYDPISNQILSAEELTIPYGCARALKDGFYMGGEEISMTEEAFTGYIPVIVNPSDNTEYRFEEINMYYLGSLSGEYAKPFVVNSEKDLVVFFDHIKEGNDQYPYGTPVINTYRIVYP